MKKLIVACFTLLVASAANAQEIGIGGEYKITDNRYDTGFGVQFSFEIPHSERLSFQFLHSITVLRYSEVSEFENDQVRIVEENSGSSVFFGLGAMVNYHLIEPGDHFSLQAGAGAVLYGSVYIGIYENADDHAFGRTEFRGALTMKYSRIADSSVGFYISVIPSIMLRSESHNNFRRGIGEQIKMTSFQGGITLDLAKN